MTVDPSRHYSTWPPRKELTKAERELMDIERYGHIAAWNLSPEDKQLCLDPITAFIEEDVP